VSPRRAALAVLVGVVLLAILAPSALAHPLGNFTTNHLSTVRISEDRIEIHYVLDEAEIPTVRNQRLARGELVDAKREEILAGLALEVDGRDVALRPTGAPSLSFLPGQAGLKTTRLELDLRAAVSEPRVVELRDKTFSGRQGLQSIVVEPGDGTAVRTSTPTGDPTGGLRRYPQDILDSPLNRTEASFRVREGDGTLVAPRSEGGDLSTTRDATGEGFASLFEGAAAGDGVLVLLLLAAFGWGALHALSPGHGKAMVAAYLAGTRGTARHAVGLGVIVTVTHTIGVFALGIVALSLQQFILPEDIYPWLTLVSGLLVVVIGASVLRSRIRWGRARMVGVAAGPAPSPDAAMHSHDDDEHSHAHGHAHPHPHTHNHDSHAHQHMPDELTWRGVLAMGASAGLIPCPSALVVLLAAVSQNELALGLLLIVAFSVGLAGTLTGLGLGVVYAKRLLPRLAFGGRLVSALPAASAVLIVLVGLALTARAMPGVV
jgi:ABC-type nickel/cobalt efflux system permease component RcnA